MMYNCICIHCDCRFLDIYWNENYLKVALCDDCEKKAAEKKAASDTDFDFTRYCKKRQKSKNLQALAVHGVRI